MRIKDIKKALCYIARIAKDPFSRQSRSALLRYIRELFLVGYEKIRGLDFTMVYQCDTNEHNNNYSKSPKKILQKVFEDIDFSQPHNFIDLGCGKGYVLTCAAGYPFRKVGGVEYTQELYEICEKNLRRLKLDWVSVYHCDAKAFTEYGDYDNFYFCNPFDETILSVVAKRIADTHKDSTCRIYYLNPHQKERQRAILDAGFNLVKVIENKYEKYFDINVYEK